MTRLRAPRPRVVCRAAAGLYLVAVLVAVLWGSGAQIAAFKESAGPWFLDAAGKDVVLNLVMLSPLTLLAHLGWPRVAWWRWALAGCALEHRRGTLSIDLPRAT